MASVSLGEQGAQPRRGRCRSLEPVAAWRHVASACALVALAVGVAVLAAWLLRPLRATGVSFLWLMRANTALCIVLVSAAALLVVNERSDGRGRVRRGLAAVAAVVAAVSLVEHATGWNAGIDEVLAADPTSPFAGRMSPWTAGALALLAAVAFFHRSRRDRAADVALVGAGTVLQLVFAGYLYGVIELYGTNPLTRVSPPTLVCLALAWAALLGGRLGRGLLAVATRPSAGGVTLRVLLPVAWTLPVLFGWARLLAQREGILTPSMGTALFAVGHTLTLSALIWWFAPRLDALEVRFAAERERRENLERFVAMCAWTGRIRSNGEWLSVERYLAERFGVAVTHTISDEAAARVEAEIAAEEVAERERE